MFFLAKRKKKKKERERKKRVRKEELKWGERESGLEKTDY